MPGLIEMHAHLDDGYGENFGRVWLAYGITSLRIPSINPYAGLEQREAFDAGRRPGPRVFLAGDPFDGARVYYPGGVSVTSDEQLDRELDRASALGVDFFKTYVRLPDRLQKRIVDFAHAQNKPVTSHELYPAVAFGIDGVEHLSGTSRRGYSPKLSATGPRLPGRHRSDREVGRHADADDRHHGRVSRARDRRQDAAVRSAARAVSAADRRAADRPGRDAAGPGARSRRSSRTKRR